MTEITEIEKKRRKARDAAYRAANADKIKVRRATRDAANRDKIRATRAKYYAANHDKILTEKAAYYAANPDKIRAKNTAYRAVNLDKIKAKDAIYQRDWSILAREYRAIYESNTGERISWQDALRDVHQRVRETVDIAPQV